MFFLVVVFMFGCFFFFFLFFFCFFFQSSKYNETINNEFQCREESSLYNASVYSYVY